MKTRYQVFISSTFKNLESERDAIIKTTLRANCFPAGMELFPGIDEEQFEYIKQIIDDSDYYVVILGGLYGTMASDGLSYTEKEFDYAKSNGKKIIALVQKNPNEKETDDNRIIKYTNFHKKITDERLISYWNNSEELVSKYATSLDQTINKFPTRGWLRCDSYKCERRLELVDMNSRIANLTINNVKSIHIMASGTSSYIPIVKSLLKANKQAKRTVNVYVYFRLGKDEERIELLKTQYNQWWNNILKEYPKLKYHFSCVSDFKVSFRGVIVNKKMGLVGFYVRNNNTTLGTLEDSIFVDTNTNAGGYIIKSYLKCFDNQKEYPDLKSCVNGSI